MKMVRGADVLFLFVAVSVFGQGNVPFEFAASQTNGQALASFLWSAEPSDFYEILTTTHLADGVWTAATLDPIPATNLIAAIELFSTNSTAFFQVRHLDTQGPEMVSRYPDDGAVGVATQAVMLVELLDPSGIDTNSIALTFNGGSAIGLDDARLSLNGNTVQFFPDSGWGEFAETSVVVLACADMLGNPFLSEWSFMLERDPLVSANAFLIGAGGAQSVGREMAAALTGDLTLVEAAPGYLRLSYSGSHGLSIGALLVSDDADAIFYRRVLSLNESVPGEVKAFTEDVLLTALIEKGSFETSNFTMIEGGAQAMGAISSLNFAYTNTFSQPAIGFGAADLDVDASIAFSGGVVLHADIDDGEIQVFNADIEGSLEVDIDAALEVLVPLVQIDGEHTLVEQRVARGKALIDGWPIWVDVVVGVYVCAEGSADGVFIFEQSGGFSATNWNTFKWTPDGGWTTDKGGSFSADSPAEPALTAGVEGSASVYLRPEVTVRIHGAVEVCAGYRRGLSVEASWQVDDSQCVFEVFDTASVNVGAEVIGVGNGNLPETNLWEETQPMDVVWYWPELPLSVPIVLSDPVDKSAKPGETVSFHASAFGNPAPTYKWFRNGQLVASGNSLSVTAGNYTTGDYTFKAANNQGSTWSAEATLSLSGGGGSSGEMVYIPEGSFLMGDSFDEGGSDEHPVHSVYVGGFYMGATEVTKAQWDEVYNWAVVNGYRFDHAGSGKATNHPVHTVSWYDCVKWCNARSEKEGRTPSYNLSTWSCNYNANGYRLPTEAEWEKAARGGQSGKRFPWGNLITHDYANYSSSSSYSYDTSSTRGYHPSYNTGSPPFTSPVGAFSANAYGLYDMVGNLWEWCGDWYGSTYYASSSASNPRGALSGSHRVGRGCCWSSFARYSRSAYRGWSNPSGASNSLGFRICLPAD